MTLLDQAAQETVGELTHGALDFDAGVNMSSTKGKGAFTAEFFTANLPAQLIGIRGVVRSRARATTIDFNVHWIFFPNYFFWGLLTAFIQHGILHHLRSTKVTLSPTSNLFVKLDTIVKW